MEYASSLALLLATTNYAAGTTQSAFKHSAALAQLLSRNISNSTNHYTAFSVRYNPSPFNAGIKSLRATLLDEIFYSTFYLLNVNFVNICVKNQQMQQLFIQFINYVW
jgi:hypothetical protein